MYGSQDVSESRQMSCIVAGPAAESLIETLWRLADCIKYALW